MKREHGDCNSERRGVGGGFGLKTGRDVTKEKRKEKKKRQWEDRGM